MRTISVCGSACGKPSLRIWFALCDWPVVASSMSRFLVPTTAPRANAAMTNASQPKTAVFQWLALQRPIRAAMLFERLSGDMSGLLLRVLTRRWDLSECARRRGSGHRGSRRRRRDDGTRPWPRSPRPRCRSRLRSWRRRRRPSGRSSPDSRAVRPRDRRWLERPAHVSACSPSVPPESVASRSQRPIARLRRICGPPASSTAVIRTQKGRRPPGSGGLRREEEVGGLGGLGKVRVNQRVRQLPLRANYRDAVPLELVRGRSVLAKRLALQHELTKLSVQLVDIHAWSFAPTAARSQGAGWRPVVRFSLGNQSTLVIAEAGSQCERSGTGWRRTNAGGDAKRHRPRTTPVANQM